MFAFALTIVLFGFASTLELSPIPAATFTFKHVSAKGAQLWAINQDNRPARYAGGSWEIIGSNNGTYVAAVAGGALLVDRSIPIDRDSNLYRFDLASAPAQWYSIPGWAFIINGDVGLHVGKDADLWYKRDASNSDLWHTNAWEHDDKAGNNNLQAAVGEDGERWRLDKNHTLYRSSGPYQAWESVPTQGIGSLTYVDVQDKAKVVVTDDTNSAYLVKGKEFELVSKDCKQATIGYEYVYCINAKGQIDRYSLKNATNVGTPVPAGGESPKPGNVASQTHSDVISTATSQATYTTVPYLSTTEGASDKKHKKDRKEHPEHPDHPNHPKDLKD